MYGSKKTATGSEVFVVARRRKFTTSYTQRIVREADACIAPGAIGALLRRDMAVSNISARQNKPSGPKAYTAKAVDRRVANLELEVAKLREERRKGCIQ